MYSIKALHDRAMLCTYRVFVARGYNRSSVKAWARIAAFYEVSAADKVAAMDGNTEPTRAILHYSAGFCALEAGDYATARRMLEQGRETVRHARPARRLGELEEALRESAQDAA
jgi:hypothetical protein